MLSGVIVFYQIPPGDEMKCLFTSVFSRKKFDDILIVFRMIVSVISCYIMLSSVAFITLKGIKDT